MWHELMEKEKAAARNAAHAVRERLERLMPARHARSSTTTAPPMSPGESPPPPIESPPETKPPML